MPEVIVTTRDEQEKSVRYSSGYTLLQAMLEGGIDEILALCGGVCFCGTCHIYVDPASASKLPAMSEDESDLLDASEQRTEHSRLSCQIRLGAEHDQLRVTIAPED